MRPISLLIADDHELVRKSFVSLLDRLDFVTVIGEASNGRELLNLMKTNPTDLVLLDLEMPVMSGYQALEEISKNYPDARVIILSMHCDAFVSHEMMLRGARACITKNCDVNTLVDAITEVYKTGYHFNPEVSKGLLLDSMRQSGTNPRFAWQPLTERETEVLKLLCAGLTNRQTAARLKITPRTVDFHRGNLYTKTNSSNITDLMRYAIQHGLVSPQAEQTATSSKRRDRKHL